MKIGNLDSMYKDMKSGVFDFTINGICSQCGQCCSNLLVMSETDISRIKKYIKKHNVKPCNHFLPTAFPLLDMICPFRDNDKKICSIYSVRPIICREFKCDKAKKGFVPCKELMESDIEIVNVRELFFGK